jgi:hypothetical protein
MVPGVTRKAAQRERASARLGAQGIADAVAAGFDGVEHGLTRCDGAWALATT